MWGDVRAKTWDSLISIDPLQPGQPDVVPSGQSQPHREITLGPADVSSKEKKKEITAFRVEITGHALEICFLIMNYFS